jgi:hypothetical protein
LTVEDERAQLLGDLFGDALLLDRLEHSLGRRYRVGDAS